MLEPWLIQTLILGAVSIGTAMLVMRSVSVSFRNFERFLTTEPETEKESVLSTDDTQELTLQKIMASEDSEEIAELVEVLKQRKRAFNIATGEYERRRGMRESTKLGAGAIGATAGMTYRQALNLWTGLPSAVKILVNNMVRSKLGKSVDDILGSAQAFQEGLALALPLIQSTTALAPKKDTFDPSMPYTPPGYLTQPTAAAAR